MNELKNDKKGFGRNAYYQMAIYQTQNNQLNKALLSYLNVLYLDLSGVENYRYWTACPGSDNESMNFRLSCIVPVAFAPSLIKDIKKLINTYYKESMVDEIYSKTLPILACSKTMFSEIYLLLFPYRFVLLQILPD